jgi:hypothetical protein
MGIAHNGLAVGDVALSLGYVRAPYCLLRVMGIILFKVNISFKPHFLVAIFSVLFCGSPFF